MSRATVTNPTVVEPLDLLKSTQDNMNCTLDIDIFDSASENDVVKPELFENDRITQQLDLVCKQLGELAANQRETNTLLKAFIQSKQFAPTSQVPQSQINLSLPDIVYLKRRGMSMLISLTKTSTRKVWCTECDKKVSVTKKYINQDSLSSVQTVCGHFTSCSVCKHDVLKEIMKCSHCNSTHNTGGFQSNEKCPVCDSDLCNKEMNVDSSLMPALFVLVNVNDPNQCSHTANVSNRAGKREREVNEVEIPPAKRATLSYQWNPSPMVYGGVRKAMEVGSGILTRMTYYEENETDDLFII